MTLNEASELLAFIAGADGRVIADRMSTTTWADLLSDVDFADAKDAAREFYRNPLNKAAMRPADILAAVGTKSQDAIEADVRSARARKLIGIDWSNDKPLSPEVQAKLDGIRKAELDQIETSWGADVESL